MLFIDGENANKVEQSEELLHEQEGTLEAVPEAKKEEAPHEIPLWKRIVLFAIGLFGVQVFGLLISLATIFLPKETANAVTNFVTYGLLFLALVGIVLVDIPRLLYHFKTWWKYALGIVIGLFVIGFDIFYTNIVNLFYNFGINDNESGIRSIVEIYPLSSILIFGIVGPVCEELTYRVGLFGSIAKKNKVIAYIVTIIVFGFIHFNFTSKNIVDEFVCLPMYLASGFLLTFAYDKLGFAASSMAHITNNMFSVVGQIILKNLGQ